jgi:uncharacterized membrane protein
MWHLYCDGWRKQSESMCGQSSACAQAEVSPGEGSLGICRQLKYTHVILFILPLCTAIYRICLDFNLISTSSTSIINGIYTSQLQGFCLRFIMF